MKSRIYYWRYLGLSKNTIVAYEDKVAVDNISILCTESLVMTAICILLSIILIIHEFDFIKNVFLFIAAFMFLIIYILAGRIYRIGARRFSTEVNVLIITFQITLFILSIAMGVYERSQCAIFYDEAILLALISFDMEPVKNLIVLASSWLIFIPLAFTYKTRDVFWQDIIYIFSVSAMTLIISWKKSRDKWEHEEAVELIVRNNTTLYKTSATDYLTGLTNRRKAFDNLEVASAQASVSGHALCCMIMDIDFFKKYNDTYGHPEGDRLLEALGTLFLNIEKEHKITFSRIGGEEFMCYFETNESMTSQKIAGEILEGVRKLPHPESKEGKYSTISIGICECVPGILDNGNRLYVKADTALYEAKKNGRNRAEYYDVKVDKQ